MGLTVDKNSLSEHDRLIENLKTVFPDIAFYSSQLDEDHLVNLSWNKFYKPGYSVYDTTLDKIGSTHTIFAKSLSKRSQMNNTLETNTTMKKILLPIILSSILLFSCKTKSVQADNKLNSGVTYSDALDNPSEVMTADWERFYSDSEKARYICLKGTTRTSVKNQIEEFSELNGPGEVEYVYGICAKDDWVYVKIPDSHSAYSFHNLTYWFLGVSEDDPLSSKESVGIFMGENDSYCIYNDYDLRSQYEVLDVLFLTSKNGVRELVSIPFDVAVVDEEELIPSYSQVLNDFNLSEKELKQAAYESVSFYYPE